ncbi:hypothetical protein CMV_018043 [Castanea mollissima]|uniref:Uncharacterized protein n=1 Tax=Castanea mollissima TaxID=60419 RepID=A0A8J4QPK6_9ROSI|nr:hypothetical protein CMV_018043 [Castanea mollissima]
MLRNRKETKNLREGLGRIFGLRFVPPSTDCTGSESRIFQLTLHVELWRTPLEWKERGKESLINIRLGKREG